MNNMRNVDITQVDGQEFCHSSNFVLLGSPLYQQLKIIKNCFFSLYFIDFHYVLENTKIKVLYFVFFI